MARDEPDQSLVMEGRRQPKPTARVLGDDPFQPTEKSATANASKKRKQAASAISTPSLPINSLNVPHGVPPTKQQRTIAPVPSDEAIILTDVDEMNDDGFLKDLDHIAELPDVHNEERKARPTADVKNFFINPRTVLMDGGKKKRVDCKICMSKKASQSEYVDDASTNRRHMQKFHRAEYHKWCTAHQFISMLPDDAKQRREELHSKLTQSSLDLHLQDITTSAPTLTYSDRGFISVLLQWLIQTDQPLQSFDHPAFQSVLYMAAKAGKDGIKIPGRKLARSEIMTMFYKYLGDLKKTLTSDAVPGTVSLTCDGWSASNVDSYFAVTAHWIEAASSKTWTLKGGLIGFVLINGSHTGVRLGQALFKVARRVGIEGKIGYVTCDNASNNDTMMDEFARLIEKETGKDYDGVQCRIRCMAHVVNLAVQALLKSYSPTKHYNAKNPDESEPVGRDVVGIVRTIAVKEHSSSKRKDLFSRIQNAIHDKAQERADMQTPPVVLPPCRPKRLLLDMPVRWSSTFMMLHRAMTLRVPVGRLISELAKRESNYEKREKLRQLRLDDAEWTKVTNFIKVLQVADDAQQMFSSDTYPSLHRAISAFEHIHGKWKSYRDVPRDDGRYIPFKDALDASIEVIEEYYQLTADSDAHIICALIDPTEKLGHFEGWEVEDRIKVRQMAQKLHERLYRNRFGANGPPPPSRHSRKPGRMTRLMQLSDDEDDIDMQGGIAAASPSSDFDRYLDSPVEILGDMTIVEWWGLNAYKYPGWALIAQNYLAVMASSVSSERAFSAAGITITKRRNRLKGDIVEALQTLKCAFRHELLTREPQPSSKMEKELEEEDELEDSLIMAARNKSKTTGTSHFLLELDSEDDDSEIDDEGLY